MGVSTQTLRNRYPDFVVGGVSRDWTITGALRCDYSKAIRVQFLAGGEAARLTGSDRIGLAFHIHAVQWAKAIAAVMLYHNYSFDELAGGSVSCRAITGPSRRTSGHAHGCMVDHNPSRNRYRIQVGPVQWGRQTDMSLEMVHDIALIRTTAGHRAVEWGGRWTNIKDPMHHQPYVADVRGIDVSTVKGWRGYQAWLASDPSPQEDDALLPIKYGHGFTKPPTDSGLSGDQSHRRDDVKLIQILANLKGKDVDGQYGNGTAGAVADALGIDGSVRVVGASEYSTLQRRAYKSDVPDGVPFNTPIRILKVKE